MLESTPTIGEAATAVRLPPGVGPAAAHAGAVLAGRYRLDAPVGAGGFGVVWRARDLLSDEDVAVKAMQRLEGRRLERLRREVAALRLLRLPGVVRLLDDGQDDDAWFLVMELIQGRPFPGPLPSPCPWDTLSDVALGLFETMGRVHATGIVHRDLKPSNVLVTDDLRPVVLDFGLARGPAMGATITLTGAMVGTPAWLSPEQILGEPVGPATDLYALGLMLYQALSGRLPHATGEVRDLWADRVSTDAAPLRSVAQVPVHVADVVDSLLAREPEDRPSSAFEVVEALLRRGPARRRNELPWLGSDRAVDHLVTLATAGRSARVEGPAGVGRSAVLHRTADRLTAAERTVLWPAPATRPFESLAPILDEAVFGAGSLDGMLGRVDEALGDLLARGGVILVDRATALDGWSRHALVRAASRGAVLSVDPEAAGEVVEVAPLTEAQLRDLFVGVDRLHHEREDAARELFLRTDGLPARVRDEVAAWVRAGVARWSEGRLATSRASLDSLAAGLRVAPAWVSLPDRRVRATVDSGSWVSSALVRPRNAHRELLAWVTLAWPFAAPALLANATGEPLWRVEAGLAELEELRLVVLDGSGCASPTAAAITGGATWTDDQRKAAHGRLASLLPPGDSRLWHLVAAGAERRVVVEALAVIGERRKAGAVGRATATAVEALAAARAAADVAGELALIDALTRIALADGTVAAIDRALYEVGRAGLVNDPLGHLLRAVRTAATEVGGRVVSEIERLSPFDDPELELARREALVRAARGLPPEEEQAAVEASVAWARGCGWHHAAVAADIWGGMRLYRAGQYDEAGAMLGGAASRARAPLQRLAALEDAAAAWLEAGRLADALAAAEEARTSAAALRMPLIEGRAEWLGRTARYRSGAPLTPDLELVAAADALAMPHFLAQVCFTEAAIALRARALETGSDLACRAEAAWRAGGRRWEPALASALAAACGVEVDVDALGAEAAACPILGFGVQILGLLSLAARHAQPPLGARPEAAGEGGRPSVAAVEALARAVPADQWALRIDVLSIDECLAAARGAWAP